MMTEPAQQRIAVARFLNVRSPRVVEHWDFTQIELLEWLEKEPRCKWEGTNEHPGWSPVRYDPPIRARENVKEVFALVLDYDKKATFDGVIQLWGRFLGLVYTTKSHDIGAHRLRVVLPLSRPCSADEYDRLWQWADRQSTLSDLKTDGQAKDASRFWYIPSPPENNTWRADRLHGSVLEVDATLPQADVPKLRLVQAPEPLTTDAKTQRARAYLARIPAAVSGDGGHTQTFNAVAHVMFGFDLDRDTTFSIIANDYNPRCDPPWSEKELQHKIKSVAERCQRERGYLLKPDRPPIHTTQAAADQAPELPDEHDVDWRSGCAHKKDGTLKRAYVNVERLVCFHPDYRGRFKLNEMTEDIWLDGKPMRESVVHDIRSDAEHKIGHTPSPSDVEAAIRKSAEFRPFHPVRDYLQKTCKWDGTLRISDVARDFLGTESPLHAVMLRRWMIGAVARALRPGCKLDTALMLFGDQGFGKSTFFSVLGGEWHADSFIDISNKDSFVQIHAAWIYEFSELENVVTGRSESRLKAWLTSTHDMYRAPYAKGAVRKARGVAICGTTNRQQILTDDTGSRRFWIVPVHKKIDTAALAVIRDQLWAEAVNAFESGESWWLDSDLECQREAANENFVDEDPWQEAISDHLSSPLLREITVASLLRDALKLDASRQDSWAQKRVARILRRMGWSRSRETDGERRWVYRRHGVLS